MSMHAAFGLELKDLDVVIVDESRHMQTILRSILLMARVRRIRAFDRVDDALAAMTSDPPNFVIAEWLMRPLNGRQLLKRMKRSDNWLMRDIPVMIITSYCTRVALELAIQAGAHFVLAKPFSPSSVLTRLKWVLADDRPMIVTRAGSYIVAGAEKVFYSKNERWKLSSMVHAANLRVMAQARKAQANVDQVFEADTLAQRPFAGRLSQEDEIRREQRLERRRLRKAHVKGQAMSDGLFARQS